VQSAQRYSWLAGYTGDRKFQPKKRSERNLTSPNLEIAFEVLILSSNDHLHSKGTIHAYTAASSRFIDGPVDETEECTNTRVFVERLEPLWRNASILPSSKFAKPFKSCLACS
jgi:hypothetical protein